MSSVSGSPSMSAREQDRRAGLSALDHRGHGSRGRAEPRLQPERAELLDEDRLRRWEVEADLRRPVEPPSEVDGGGQRGARVGEDVGERVGGGHVHGGSIAGRASGCADLGAGEAGR